MGKPPKIKPLINSIMENDKEMMRIVEKFLPILK